MTWEQVVLMGAHLAVMRCATIVLRHVRENVLVLVEKTARQYVILIAVERVKVDVKLVVRIAVMSEAVPRLVFSNVI